MNPANQIVGALGTAISTTPAPTEWWKRSSFPYSQYKDLMPEDQFQKLLAMHENSAANAAMYVCIVLSVYLILLSLLLCRYMKRRPPIRELPAPVVQSREPSQGSHGMSWTERIVCCASKPLDSLRHCSLPGGDGVGSISSEELEDDPSHHRRDSTIIRMNQLRPNSSTVSPIEDVGGGTNRSQTSLLASKDLTIEVETEKTVQFQVP